MERQIEAGRLTAYCADDTEILSRHFHNGYEIIFIEEGSADFVIDGKEYVYGANSIIFINNLEKHEMRPVSKKYIRHVVIIDPDYFDRFVGDQVLRSIFKQRPSGFQNGFLASDTDAAEISLLMRGCEDEFIAQRQFYELGIMSRILTLLILLYRGYGGKFPSSASGRSVANASMVQGFIDRNYLEDISLDSLSAHFHLNKFHLLEQFRQVTGYTIKQYIALKRISHAKNMLYYTDSEITQIAIQSGFNSASNFIRAFKNAEGVTPLSYRKLSH